jgi:hypothetical protein
MYKHAIRQSYKLEIRLFMIQVSLSNYLNNKIIPLIN